MSETDIRELAEDVLYDFYSFSVADVKMILTDTLKTSRKTFNICYQELYQTFSDAYHRKLNWAAERTQKVHRRTVDKQKREARKVSNQW